MQPLTDAKAKQYGSDIIAFLSDHYVLPETMKTIQLEWWQIEYILKPLFYDLDSKGMRKYNTAVIAMPKKNGKSALGAGIGVDFLFCDELYGEIIIAANAKDQASMIIYNKMRRSILLDRLLKKATHPLRKESITVHSTGSLARCVAHQFETAAGLNPSLTIFDELWGFSDRKFFDELTIVPTRPNPLIVIVTYAGYNEQGLLWDLYQDGLKGTTILDTGDPEILVKRGQKDPSMFMFWSHKNLASWVTDKYLKSQQGRMPPEVYARLHENRWVSASSKFITKADIDSIHDTPWLQQPAATGTFNYIVATDLGLSHDKASRVVGHYDPKDGNVYVDSIRIWRGTPESHVPIKEVEQDLIDTARAFNTATLVVDPWQMEYVIQRLQNFYTVIPFNFASDLVHLSQMFVNAVRSRRLKSYTEPELDKEMGNLIIRQTAQGWRIDHVAKQTNDIVISIGMMLIEAIRDIVGWEEGDDAAGGNIDLWVPPSDDELMAGNFGREF